VFDRELFVEVATEEYETVRLQWGRVGCGLHGTAFHTTRQRVN